MAAETGTSLKICFLALSILGLASGTPAAFAQETDQQLLGGVLDIEVFAGTVFSVSQSGLVRHEEEQVKVVFVPPFRPTSLTQAITSRDEEGFLLAGGEPAISGSVGFYGMTSKTMRMARVADDLVYDVAYCEKSGRVVVGCADGRVLMGGLPDTLDGKFDVRMTHTAPVRAIAVSADGKFVASAGLDSLVLLAELESGSKPIPILDHTDKVESIIFTSDSKRLVSGARDGKVRLHSIDGRLLRTFSKLGGLELSIPWKRKNQILSLASYSEGEIVLAGSSLGYVFRLSEPDDTSEIVAHFSNPARAIRAGETGIYVGAGRVRRLAD